MTETEAQGRPRRTAAAGKRLDRMRRRLADQAAEQQQRERVIEQALRDYVAAIERATAANRACEGKIGELERRIERLREQARDAVTGELERQAAAAWTIHQAGRTIGQVGDLLELTPKQARQLITTGRALADAARSGATPAGSPQGPAEGAGPNSRAPQGRVERPGVSAAASATGSGSSGVPVDGVTGGARPV